MSEENPTSFHLPESFIKLILQSFSLSRKDRILELGSGEGELAVDLASFTDVNTTPKSINNLIFPKEQYKLIISFEYFHLIPDQKAIVSRCLDALVTNGYLCISWIRFEWESALKSVIEDAYRPYGIKWDDWGYWTCPNLPLIIQAFEGKLSPIEIRTIEIPSRTRLDDIVAHMLSTQKTAHLAIADKDELGRTLGNNFKKRYPTGWTDGNAIYTLAYSTKLNF